MMHLVQRPGLTAPAVAGQLERGVRQHQGFTRGAVRTVLLIPVLDDQWRSPLRAAFRDGPGLLAAARAADPESNRAGDRGGRAGWLSSSAQHNERHLALTTRIQVVRLATRAGIGSAKLNHY